MTHQPPPLDTSAFDAACREPEPECSGFASDADIHPDRLRWLFWVAAAMLIVGLAVGALTP